MNQLAMARKKTKLMAQVTAELFYCKSSGEYSSRKRDRLFAKLWEINMMYRDYARVAEENSYSLDDYKSQCIMMEKLGLERDGQDYIPLAVVSFARPLEYMAANKVEFAESDDRKKHEMVSCALKILNDSYADEVVILKD